MNEVTLVVTSCSRHDLLLLSLESFIKFNTHPIAKTIVVEDSALTVPDWFDSLQGLGEKLWITNGKHRGQTYSIDRAYSEVSTKYIFHTEDDFVFTRSEFIEDSMFVLEKFPHVWTCNLRAKNCNGHPVVIDTVDGEGIPVLMPYWNEGWGGSLFNPHLLRRSSYQELGSYGRRFGYASHGFQAELKLSIENLDKGYRICSLPLEYTKHIGEGRSIAANPTMRPKVPKVLIAVPACWKRVYGVQQDNGIHKDSPSSPRLDAIRRTWSKYVEPFSSYVDLKFFYGRGEGQELPSDSVRLDVADDYVSLPLKVEGIFKYALENGYTHCVKADDDTWIYVDRLMALDFDNIDYTGYATDDERCHESGRYASGGCGYIVSRKSMEILVNSGCMKLDWAEDRVVGKILFSHGIKAKRDARFLPGFWKHFVDLDLLPTNHSYITMHAVSPEGMDRLFSQTLPPSFSPVNVALDEKTSPPPQRRAVLPQIHKGNQIPRRSPIHIDYGPDGMTRQWVKKV